MTSPKIAFLLILCFFTIVFLQSGLDKVFDKKGNLDYLYSLLGSVFSKNIIRFAFYSVTLLELISGLLCAAGLFDYFLSASSLFGLIGLIVGSFALLILLFGHLPLFVQEPPQKVNMVTNIPILRHCFYYIRTHVLRI